MFVRVSAASVVSVEITVLIPALLSNLTALNLNGNAKHHFTHVMPTRKRIEQIFEFCARRKTDYKLARNFVFPDISSPKAMEGTVHP